MCLCEYLERCQPVATGPDDAYAFSYPRIYKRLSGPRLQYLGHDSTYRTHTLPSLRHLRVHVEKCEDRRFLLLGLHVTATYRQITSTVLLGLLPSEETNLTNSILGPWALDPMEKRP
jgi:hypothetical protein